jgi:C4-dicarboxylate-specific signal transduction histidine kinase
VRSRTGELIGHVGTTEDISARKRAEAELERVHRQLIKTSRQAGMAEVATSVLHNVGNVLNSVNVSSGLVSTALRNSKVVNLSKVVKLLDEHQANLSEFLTRDPKGKKLPVYLAGLAQYLVEEQTAALKELGALQANIEHIKDIVAMQQGYAKICGAVERVKVAELVDDALRMSASALSRHDVQLVRDYGSNLPDITVDKPKVMQILVNLIRNAKDACKASGRPDRRIAVRLANGEGKVKITVSDNGTGIPTENLTRVFAFGFTTKKDGHGFGLHSGCLAAREMGGALVAQSDGPGNGAAFTLELPVQALGRRKLNHYSVDSGKTEVIRHEDIASGISEGAPSEV